MEKITLNKSVRIPGTDIILEKGDKVSYGYKMDEAFRHEAADSVVTKICNVIGRRMGKTIKAVFPAFVTENKNGKFATYSCVVLDTKKIFAINFKMNGSSDEIWSIGICKDPMRFYVQNTEINLNGFNVVQVVDQIADILSGDENEYFESVKLSTTNGKTFKPFQERTTFTDICAVWMNENPTFIPQITSDSFDYASNVDSFNAFTKARFGFNRLVKAPAWRYYCRKTLQENPKLGNGSKIPSVSVSAAPAPTKVGASVTTKWDSIISTVFGMDANEKWDMYEKYVSMVANGNRNALIAYGMPGTGKTYNAKRVLIEHGIPYDDGNGGNVLSSTIPDIPALMTFLYRNKDEQVIVFDDCDNLLAKGSDVRANICKKLFDLPEIRHIGYNKPIKDKETGDIIPSIFDFKARVIMLSNKQLDFFDPAVISRSLHIELNFTVEEMLDLIKQKLEYLGEDNWELSLQDKMEVFDFYKDIMKRLTQVSLRTFVFALQGRSMAKYCGLDWHKLCLFEMKDYIIWNN